MPESVSSLLGVEGSEALTQRADDDSLSAESLDSGSHGKDIQLIQHLFLFLYEHLVKPVFEDGIYTLICLSF